VQRQGFEGKHKSQKEGMWQVSGQANECFDCEAAFQNMLQRTPRSARGLVLQSRTINLLLLLLTGTSLRFIYGSRG
jgi:hypothetical protein